MEEPVYCHCTCGDYEVWPEWGVMYLGVASAVEHEDEAYDLAATWPGSSVVLRWVLGTPTRDATPWAAP